MAARKPWWSRCIPTQALSVSTRLALPPSWPRPLLKGQSRTRFAVGQVGAGENTIRFGDRSQLGASMGYFILEGLLFVLGILAFIVGKVPVTRRRMARGSAARLARLILMAPLPLYLLACKRSNVAPL